MGKQKRKATKDNKFVKENIAQQSEPITGKRPPAFFNYLSILLNLALAYVYIKLWVAPQPDELDQVFYMAILMGFEFIMVHSGVFMTVMPFKLSVLIFVPIYALFALAFTSMVGDLSILWLYLVVVLNRMRCAFFNTDKETKAQLMGTSALAAMIYFLLIMILAIGSSLIPKLGLSDAFLQAANYAEVKKHGGLLTDEPQVAMCFGALYYTLLAVVDYLTTRSLGVQVQQFRYIL